MLDVIKNRIIYYIIAGILFVFSIFSLLFIDLNYGIDMTGGVQMEYSYTGTIDIDTLRNNLEAEKSSVKHLGEAVFTSVQVYKITGEEKIGVIAGINSKSMSEKEVEDAKTEFKQNILSTLKKQNNSFYETLYINIGESFGAYIRNTAVLTLVIALLGIGAYVTYAFSGFASGISSFSFGMITLITLFHDVFVAAGLYIFCSIFFKEYQIDTFFITALLTILGYSISDTIVIFDRIRSNLVKNVKKGQVNLYEVINHSINETLTRSIYTSLTLFIVLVAIFIYGPVTIKGFILVMIFGTLVGTYSSIFIASPILYDFNKNKKIKAIEKKQYNPDDKIVV